MEKIKKLIAGMLVLSLLFLCSACMIQGENDDNSKWVMTKQTKSTVNEQGTEKLIYEIDYKYDSYGRKNYEVWSIMPGSTYVYSDFEYDGNGNVVSCKHNYKDEVFNINENSDCTYVYDKNNNLIKSTVSGTSSIDITTYKYDEKGNLICAEYSWTDTQYQDEDNVTHNYSLIYENDICVSAEVIIDSSSSEKQTYCLYNYSYDENGNKISEHQYKEVEDSSQGEVIEFNGKSYRLENIVKYTYEEIVIEELSENLGTENNSNSNNENNIIEKEETTIDPYNGLPAPIELKLVNSNEKKALGNDTAYDMEFSMHMIEDYHGLKYLVLTCSATSNFNDRKVEGPDFFPVVISESHVDLTSDLEKEVKQAYDEIIFSDYLSTTLYPEETVRDSYIYDFYREKSNITVVLKPSLHGTVHNGSNNNYIHGIYTGSNLYYEDDWEEYIFLEFSFE